MMIKSKPPKPDVIGVEVKKKLEARIEIARKTGECEIINFPIREIPSSLWDLRSISLLWINNNLLEYVDPLIGTFSNVQVIKLNGNRLRSLPEEIGLCSSLQRFWAHDNRIEFLPRTIGMLHKLEHMSLEKNQLTCLPWEFGRLTSLTAFSYDENRIPSAEDEDAMAMVSATPKTERWKKIRTYLRRLDNANTFKILKLPKRLFDIPIREYPKCVTIIADLRALELSGHQLTEISLEIMKAFSSLTVLDLNNNRIRVIQPELGNLTCLRKLKLSNNPIEVLSVLKLIGCRFSSFPTDPPN
eukprot:766024-Hanusia_phi.AAC.5